MKIYKEKQFLVFDFEDGSTVKYDFATKTCIGKRGKPVQGLCSQLRGLTIDQLCDCCTDKQYGKFLRFVKRQGSSNGYDISNIGTILSRVPYYSKYEQIFSAGIEDILENAKKFNYSISDIPKGLIKLCRKHNIKLDNMFLEFYKENPDAYILAYNQEYTSLTSSDIFDVLHCNTSVKRQYGEYYWQYTWEPISVFNKLINDYGYTTKALMNYVDYLKTYEALEDTNHALIELHDYASMMAKISGKFDKYPRHFLTTHKIACRNYNRLKQEFVERDFQKRINKDMEKVFDDYIFIYPKNTQDIKDEAVQQNNCVASYINGVIEGRHHILFLRKKEQQDKSLVTIEVRDNKIVQALQRFNNPLTSEQQEIVDKWNKWWSNKINKDNTNKESEELTHGS